MPTYRLLYFNAYGRGEVARMMMAYGGIEYEDVRFENDEWAKVKPTTPYGQAPVLEIDGEMIGQCCAIYRYLAKQTGLMGSNDLEAARIDMIVGCMEDYMSPLRDIFMAKDDEEKKKALSAKYQENVHAETARLEKLIKGDYFVGNKLSLADFVAAQILIMGPNLGFKLNMDDFPKLKAMQNNVFNEPKVAAWIKKRPVTPF